MTTVAVAEVQITATGAKVVTTALDSVHDGITKAGSAGKKASGGAAGFGKQVLGIAAGLGLVTSAAGAVRVISNFGKEAFDASLQAELFDVTLRNVAGSAQLAAAGMNAVDVATRGTLDASQQAALTSKLLSLGLADNAEQAGKFANTAATLGLAFRGLGAGESVELFNRLISNRSIKLLDDFGIGITEVNARMKQLGVTGQEGFGIAVMQVAAEKAAELGAVWDTDLVKIQALEAGFRDFRRAVGEKIKTVVIDIITDEDVELVEASLESLGQTGRDVSAIYSGEFRAGMQAAIGEVVEFDAEIRQAGKSVAFLGIVGGLGAGNQDKLAKASRIAGIEAEGHSKSARVQADALEEVVMASAGVELQTRATTEAVRNQVGAFGELRDVGTQAVETQANFLDGQTGLLVATEQQTRQWTNLNDAGSIWLQTLEQSGASEIELAGARRDLALATGQIDEGTLAAADSLGVLNEAKEAGLVTDQEAFGIAQGILNNQQSSIDRTQELSLQMDALQIAQGFAGAAGNTMGEEIKDGSKVAGENLKGVAGSAGAIVTSIGVATVAAKGLLTVLGAIRDIGGTTITVSGGGGLAGGGLAGGGLAGGGRPIPGVPTLVGEDGPEIVTFGAGAQVFSNEDSLAMAAGGGSNFTVPASSTSALMSGGGGGGGGRAPAVPAKITMISPVMLDGREIGRSQAVWEGIVESGAQAGNLAFEVAT